MHDLKALALVVAEKIAGTPTYGQIADAYARHSGMIRPHALGMGDMLDRMNNALHRAANFRELIVPPLSVIVVNQETGFPGKGLGPQILRWAKQIGWKPEIWPALEAEDVEKWVWTYSCNKLRAEFPHIERLLRDMTDEEWRDE